MALQAVQKDLRSTERNIGTLEYWNIGLNSSFHYSVILMPYSASYSGSPLRRYMA